MPVEDEYAFKVLQQRVEKMMEDVGGIKSDVRSIMQSNETTQADVRSMKDNNTWLTRSVIAAVVLAFIGFIIRGGLNVPFT